MNTLTDNPPSAAWLLLFLAWLVAATATLSALFLGEIVGLPICSMCWYQRIVMFPLAIILPIGLFPDLDRRLIRAGLALAVPGLLLALYHQGIVSGIVPERIQPCRQGVPCSETVVSWFGFVTIPLLSIVAFTTLVVLLGAALYRSRS
ncbi:MAG: disulfide bond formation protein B [Rhodocyclaceae bacterium]|nr:disulfide bond formation protein B [Rhodocyclaceae bacterium]MDZ4214143.1 disulfide bond formation protein B [Rhodocyclaceae bacterium]